MNFCSLSLVFKYKQRANRTKLHKDLQPELKPTPILKIRWFQWIFISDKANLFAQLKLPNFHFCNNAQTLNQCEPCTFCLRVRIFPILTTSSWSTSVRQNFQFFCYMITKVNKRFSLLMCNSCFLSGFCLAMKSNSVQELLSKIRIVGFCFFHVP